MAIKYIDPEDTYIVREMFGCGHGHVMPPGFTHWESGEACIWRHSQEYGPGYGPGPTTIVSSHLYWRLVCVPIVDDNGNDMWDKICSEPDMWSHVPIAPEGLKEGARIGDKIKLVKGAKLSPDILAKYKLANPEIIYHNPRQKEVA